MAIYEDNKNLSQVLTLLLEFNLNKTTYELLNGSNFDLTRLLHQEKTY